MGFFYRLTVTKTLCKPTLTRPLGSLWKDVLEGLNRFNRFNRFNRVTFDGSHEVQG